jgi:hypothetical protein
MTMKRYTIVMALLLTACATPYQSKGLRGGFTDVQLNKNVFQIAFNGNGYTPPSDVQNMALLRASEVTLEHGFQYFVIVANSDVGTRGVIRTPMTAMTTTTGFGTPTLQSNTVATGGYAVPFHRPGMMTTISCLDKKPEGTFAYNAKSIYDSLSKQYKR